MDVPIVYQNGRENSFESALPRWQEGIDRVWNNEFYFDSAAGKDLPVRFSPSFQPRYVDGERNPELDIHYQNPIEDGGTERAHLGQWQTLDDSRYSEQSVDWQQQSNESINNIGAHEFGHLISSPDFYGRDRRTFEAMVGREPVVGEEGSQEGRFMRRDDIMGSGYPQAQLEGLENVNDGLEAIYGEGTLSHYTPPTPIEEFECSSSFAW